MTVTIFRRRQGIAIRTARKVQKLQFFKASQLVGLIDVILTNFDHGTKNYFCSDSSRIVQYSKNFYNCLHAHGSDLLCDVRSMLADME